MLKAVVPMGTGAKVHFLVCSSLGIQEPASDSGQTWCGIVRWLRASSCNGECECFQSIANITLSGLYQWVLIPGHGAKTFAAQHWVQSGGGLDSDANGRSGKREQACKVQSVTGEDMSIACGFGRCP